MTDRNSGKIADLMLSREVSVTLQSFWKFVSITGNTQVVDDRNVERYVASRQAGVPMYLVRDSSEAAKIVIGYGLLPANYLAEITFATTRNRERKDGLLRP